jgi:hypothetical protein
MLYEPVKSLSGVNNKVQQGCRRSDFEVLDSVPEIQSKPSLQGSLPSPGD